MTARESYTHMTAEDLTELAKIIFEVYQRPNLQPSRQHKRVVMLLVMFADLEQREDVPYPTFREDIAQLASRAGAKYALALGFIRWLITEGYVVRAACDDPNTQTAFSTLAFAWHVKATETGSGGESES